MRYHRPLAILSALLGGVAGVLSTSSQFLPRLLNQSALLIGVLLLGLQIVLFVISPVAIFVVGYWVSRTADVPSEYRSIALISGLVGGAAFIGGTLIVVAFNNRMYPTEAVAGFGGFLLLLMYQALELGVKFAIASVAGAAVAYFRSHSSRSH